MSRFSTLALTGLLFASALVGTPRAEAAPTIAQRYRSGIQTNSTRVFRSLGLLGSKASVLSVRTLPPTSTVRNVTAPSRTAASVALKFQYSGFTSAQTKVLNNFISDYYDLLVAVYGEPAPEQSGKTIFVVGNDPDFASAYQPVSSPRPTDGGTIYFKYSELDEQNNSQQEEDRLNQFNFSRLVLRAFHGPNTFSYDFLNGDYIEAWQGGFADAAALYVAYNVANQPANFDPSQISPYVLPVYDFLNRPELGNAYVYTRTGEDLVMSAYRAAMAQSAFLKIAVENPEFFKDFNEKYYARFAARQNINPNQLRALAAEIVPTVEGQSFTDWVRRQYVLDTNVTVGQKLYAAILPLPVTGKIDPVTKKIDYRSRFAGNAQAFITDKTGNDTPSSGYGSLNAFDEKGTNINSYSEELRGDTLISFNNDEQPGQAAIGVGFTDFGTPTQARVTLKLRFKNAETTNYFPYINKNNALTKSTYYGVTTQGEAGTLSVKGDNGVSESITVTRGAFAGAKVYVSKPSVKTTLTIAGKTFVRNTAWLVPGDNARGVGFVLEGGAATTNFTFTTPAGASTVRMISLPLYPKETDESKILGIAAGDLKLARYRPNLSPGTLKDGVLQFGIDGQRHELYPYISTPMTPGRGYWLGTSTALSKTVVGTEPTRSQSYEIPLPGGWNQIGVPFNRTFSPTALKVRYGGFATVSYNEAIARNWIRPGIWRWLSRGGYANIAGAQSENLTPFEGYYIYVVPQSGVSLVFDTNATTTALTAASGWTVPLVASTRISRDASNNFGVTDRVAAAKPPAAVATATLRFLSSGNAEADASGAGAASGWADSFLASLDREATWNFVVEGVAKGERTYVAWGDLKSVPSDIKLTLTDKKSGYQTAMRPDGSFAYTSEGGARSFILGAKRLARPVVKTQTSQSQGVTVEVTLNVAAPGQLEVRNPAGDTIATLRSGSFPLGTSKFTWNGKMVNGKVAPVGRYRAIWLPQLAGDGSAASGFDWK